MKKLTQDRYAHKKDVAKFMREFEEVPKDPISTVQRYKRCESRHGLEEWRQELNKISKRQKRETVRKR